MQDSIYHIATGGAIRIGDVFDRLSEIPDDSIDCVVTSPPYWGLRDYVSEGQIGQERTFGEHLETMRRVFAEVRRVLKPEGTLWLNYGDSYAGGKRGGNPDDSPHRKQATNFGSLVPPVHDAAFKPKDLILMPYRVAMALQDDGWWLRSHIIWHKPNPMPESVTDRPTCAHETVFLLTKSQRYYYDQDAVRTEPAASSVARWSQNIDGQEGSARANGGAKTNGTMKAVGGPQKSDKQRGHSRRHAGFNDRWDAMPKEERQANGVNLRNVWTIATNSFKEAHFATFPPDLVEPCIKAGCPEGGTVLDPFGGSGTVGLVADRLNRRFVLIELNPNYAHMAKRRILDDAPLFNAGGAI